MEFPRSILTERNKLLMFEKHKNFDIDSKNNSLGGVLKAAAKGGMPTFAAVTK